MPNDPKGAKEKAAPQRELRNAQDLHEGSAHRPEDFDAMNPARPPKGGGERGKGASRPRSETGPEEGDSGEHKG